ncbi:MAG: fused MFS/spermidine synthase, partial [Roseibacillus sp.]|nr:fused MFS/spermidine synthase [Roseibacillus sp.]
MSTRQSPASSGAAFDAAFWGVSVCFLLSGVAGLVYQMVWMRYLSTIFGTSELAIVTVLVAYMGGLAVGAALASRRVHRLRSPIRTYAILECAIALSAVLVPLLLKGVAALHTTFLGGQAAPPPDGGLGEALAFLGLGCVVLLIPTACMGATLPILASGIVRREAQIGKRVGWLYSLNTFGAVAGTLLAAFVFIPRLGLWQTSFVGVVLNLLVAVLGWFVALRVPRVRDSEAGEDEEGMGVAVAEEDDPRWVPSGVFITLILVTMLLSGAISFVYEILWSRLLAHVLGGSMVAFATMLAAFLGGIAIGGLLGARLAGEQKRSCYWLAGVEIGAGLITLLLFVYVSSSDFADKRWGEATTGSLVNLCIWLLLPVTICIGATFPLAVRVLTSDPREAGRTAGRVYSWNTIGAIVGAVVAGYLLVPSLGYGASFKWAIVANLLLGALLLGFMKPRPAIPAAAAGALVLAMGIFYHPGPPLELLTLSPGASRAVEGKAPRLIHHAVGHSASVAVLGRQGSFLIRTNGLPEAQVFPRGGDKIAYTSIRWLPALPVVLRPESRSMLVVGFGGGTLLEAVPRPIDSIDVVELEAEVIRANRLIADHRAIDPFQDERIKVIVNDVRGALRLTDKRYDTIVSQPSHPWTAGASHLYTREFLELARDHLGEEGTFVQWLGAHFVDEDLLRSFCATMLAVFPHTQLYLIEDNFLFVGSGKSLEDPFLPGATPQGGLFRLSDYPKLANAEDVLAR